MTSRQAPEGRKPQMYFFGTYGKAGHYMWGKGMYKTRETQEITSTNPWGYGIDGELYDRRGGYSLHKKHGWTALAFIDNTDDTRPGSNGTFLAQGDFTVDQMREMAQSEFPEVAGRIPQTESSAKP